MITTGAGHGRIGCKYIGMEYTALLAETQPARRIIHISQNALQTYDSII
jgi:hypothetical protein